MTTATATGLTLRERNRERTRQDIERAAFALFASQGFEETTIEQIAAAAGISPRTFFRHFPTKEAVVFADHDRNVARLRVALAVADPRQPLLDRIRTAILVVQDPGRNAQRELTRAHLASESPTVRAHLYGLVEELEMVVVDAIAAELGSTDQAWGQAHLMAGAVFGTLRGARRAAGSIPGADPQRLLTDAFDLVERGFGRHRALTEE